MKFSGAAHIGDIVEYGFPRGHLGHLSSDEEEALSTFKELCIENGLYDPISAGGEFCHRDDALLLRFLRARRFNVPDAFKQFQDTEQWRNANEIDKLYNTIDLERYDETRRLYPQWTGRRDRRGLPVYVFEVKHLNSKTMSAYEKSVGATAHASSKTPQKLLGLFALYENLTRFVMPLCTVATDRKYPGTPITQSMNIVDISGVSLTMFWNLRSHMQDASVLATAHYPETLGCIFIIGAPSFFSTVWGWIKRWFDPITTSKIFILSHHDMKATLELFIDPANIPKKYGGELDFEFGQTPVLDPGLKDALQWEGSYKDFPPGPIYWKDKDDHIEAIAVGSVGSKERDEIICTVRKVDYDSRLANESARLTETTTPPKMSTSALKN
ncbi:CRAL/TRIO domain-containing protein [Lipomyces kononenkoae]|uniref:CRAL/TRIO domain-containing protein n=1 Tax=Lipomyces kononenkoae TaxID=34357 RepID=A0ACC3SSC6_LIPKO